MADSANNSIELPFIWPDELRNYLLASYGMATVIEPLGGGQSGSAVFRLRFARGSVVIKNVGPSEEYFYTVLAPDLLAAALDLPVLYWSSGIYKPAWLVLEDIEQPLPRDRWSADPQVISTLHRLHTAAIPEPPDRHSLFRPTWTDNMTGNVLMLLPGQERGRVGVLLRLLQRDSQPLFEALCHISGDPNPTNWGVRADCTPVLYDWERFGYGTPPLDLAIATPGLPEAGDFEKVAATYLQASGSSDDCALQKLIRDITRAKVWNIVEYLNFYAEGKLQNDMAVKRIVPDFVAWLENVNSILR